MANVSKTPWMGTISLATANTAYQLSALLAAADEPPTYITVPKAQFLALQANPGGGGAKYYIGNSNLSATKYGVQIFATQVWPIYSMDSNLIILPQIYVMCDTSSQTMHVTFITR